MASWKFCVILFCSIFLLSNTKPTPAHEVNDDFAASVLSEADVLSKKMPDDSQAEILAPNVTYTFGGSSDMNLRHGGSIARKLRAVSKICRQFHKTGEKERCHSFFKSGRKHS